jgi:DNA-binding SARP family transcriptional activator
MNRFVRIAQDESAEARLRLALLGRAHALDANGRRLKIPRMGLTLAAYLLLDTPSARVNREEAARFLWEGLDKERQSGNLRQLLLRLRALQATHGVRLFAIDEDEIALDLDGADIDLAAFRASIPTTSEEKAAFVCELYAGDLLAGLREQGRQLSQWLAGKRALLRAEFVAAILPHLEDGEDDSLSDDPSGGLKFHAATRLIAVEPFHESGYRALMRTYAARGDLSAVRRLYDRLERLLAKELGCRPSQQTRDLFETLANFAPPSDDVSTGEADERAPATRATATAQGGAPRLAIVALTVPDASPIAQELVDYFVNDLATRLSQTRTLIVTMPGSTMIGVGPLAKFDVDYLVEARARRGSASPGMVVRLLAMTTREILWASDFETTDALADTVATMVYSIVSRIESREIQFLESDPEAKSAYRLTVQAQRLLRTFDLPSVRRARTLFKAAIAAAPEHVPALAGMAHSYVLEWLLRMNPEPSLLDTAERIARMILAMCPDDHRGFQALGNVQLYYKKFDKSVENLRHSMRLNPIDLDVQVNLADALVSNGCPEEGIRLLAASKLLGRRGEDCDHWMLAGAHYYGGNYRAALGEIANMRNRAPALRLSAAAHAMLGDRILANRARTELMEFNPGFNLSQWLSIIPLRDRTFVRHYSDGLRMAGFA